MLEGVTGDREEFQIRKFVLDWKEVGELLREGLQWVVLFKGYWDELLSELLEGLGVAQGDLLLSDCRGVGKHIIIVAADKSFSLHSKEKP